MTNMSGNRYYYEVHNVSVSGTYEFYIWAVDTSGNGIRSNLYIMLVLENYLSNVYVNVNNIIGPWNGTAIFPLRYINDALAVIAVNGTIFVHNGVYLDTSISITKSMNFIGQNQNLTILDGGGILNNVIVQISGNPLFTISNFTLRNAKEGLQTQNGENATISHCIFSHCTDSGIVMSEYQHLRVTDCTFQNNNRGIRLSNCSYNQFYHNNFINNIIQVSSYFNTSNNSWDNGIKGNYWDNYRIKYPNATINRTRGTWNTPYVVNASGNNTDKHPWVYSNGYIDTIPPKVTVVYPNGGEVVSGKITIKWTALDNSTMNLNGTIGIAYSANNGSSWNLIALKQNNTGQYLWNTTTISDGNHYFIRLNASDEFHNNGSDTSNTSFSINNHNNTPGVLQIRGPSAGGHEILFNFTVNATHPTQNQIYYKWDWGDGNVTGWLGPFNSSKPDTKSHTWTRDGNYSIRVKAKYIAGNESNWSQIHPILIADQVNFSNIKPGTIYIKLLSFNKSYIYSSFLEQYGIIIILSSHELEIKAYATNIVKSVTFKAMNQLAVENMVIVDNNSSNGFSCSMNVTRGVYELTVTAYDINGTLVDTHTLFTVFFIRIGKYAT
jgi:parallel beta-helix repeat protein